jgi:hypothetical protein
MSDYIPAAHAEFDAWQQNFVTYVDGYLVDLGLGAGNLAAITAAQAIWSMTNSAHGIGIPRRCVRDGNLARAGRSSRPHNKVMGHPEPTSQ